MDLEAVILEEHSRAQTDRIAAWVGSDRQRFAALFRLMKSGAPRTQQCAAWSVARCVQHHPGLIGPWLPDAVALMTDHTLHVAVRRNLFQILQIADLPDSLHDAIFHAASEALGRPSEAVAVRAYSIRILKRFTEWYPELLPDVRRMVVEAAAGSPPAIASRAKTEFGIGRAAPLDEEVRPRRSGKHQF